MPDFTPGEWRYFPDTAYSYRNVGVALPPDALHEQVVPICMMRGTGYTAKDLSQKNHGDIEANGRLIAAAPKMYELLKQLASEQNLRSHVPSLEDFAHDARDILKHIDAV